MKSSGDQGNDKSKALAAKYKWIGIVIIVLAFIGYSIFTDSPIRKVIIGEKGVEISFAVKSVDQVPGPTEYYSIPATPETSSDSGEYDYLITVPREDPFYLSQVDYVIIEPGEDDPQNRYHKLVGTALERGDLHVKYEDSDPQGKFTIWLTYSEIENNRKIYSYTTRYIRSDGTVEIAFREAYSDGKIWYTQISPDLIELLAYEEEYNGEISDSIRLDQPHIKSVNEILQSLDNEKYRLIRGQISALALLNLCFVDGRILEEDTIWRSSQEGSLAREIGLTFEASHVIAEFGYRLYTENEYLGSRIFWEAMILLNPWDSYFYNMLGASLEGINQYESALEAYERALELDPEYVHAYENVQRLKARLGGSE